MRSWRHLDGCPFKTLLHAHPPRVQCPEHGARQVPLPQADPRSCFTALFERTAIGVIDDFYLHPVTDAVREGPDPKIQRFKQVGFRIFEHFRTAILFRRGGLQLQPATQGNPG